MSTRTNYEPSMRIVKMAVKNGITEQRLHDRLASGMPPLIAATRPTREVRTAQAKKRRLFKPGK